MKPPFSVLWARYPRTVERAVLYEELGWSDIIDHPAYQDTCAIRMSIALLRTGASLPGATLGIKRGALAGRRVEPRQRQLSDTLQHVWGKAEIYRSEKSARDAIRKRTGVVSFFRINGGSGGHIDLVHSGPHGFSECARSCFFDASEIWFWPVN